MVIHLLWNNYIKVHICFEMLSKLEIRINFRTLLNYFLITKSHSIFISFILIFKILKNTARPRDTRPLGVRTSQICGSELGPKPFELHRFYADFHEFYQIFQDTHLFMLIFSYFVQFYNTNKKLHNPRPCCVKLWNKFQYLCLVRNLHAQSYGW